MYIKILEDNYRKLWLEERVSSPFRYAIGLISKKWSLPYKGGYEKAEKNWSEFRKTLNNENNYYLFLKDIVNFADEFNFEDFWIPYLMLYMTTGKRYAPPNERSEHIPTDKTLEYEKMFSWKIKKEMQHEKLSEKGIKRKRSNKSNANYNYSDTYIDDIDNVKVYLPDESDTLIHNYQDIADKIHKYPGIPPESEDVKRINKVKTGIKRFKKELKSLTPKYKKYLDKLFA